MSLRSGTEKYGGNGVISDPIKDEWVTINTGDGDYDRNLYLEKILPEKVASNTRQYGQAFKGGLIPIEWYTLPSWWGIVQTECGQHDCPYPYPHSSCERTCIGEPFTTGYQQQNYTKQEALEFCEIVIKINDAKNEWDSYRCNNYPRSPVYCTYIRDSGALVKFAEVLKNEMKNEGLISSSSSAGSVMATPPATPPAPILTITRDEKAEQVIQIINDINNNVIEVPDWFNNNINWVQSGHMTNQQFLESYNYLVEKKIIHVPITQPTINESIKDNMIIQRLDSFSIINGRAIGQITFTAADSFNPYYYNKNIVNLIQFQTPNGVNILSTPKQNTLRFTATERTETIQYDEGMNDNTRANVESFVWSDIALPVPFSKPLKFEIVTAPTNGQPIPIPKVQTSGFMGAGVAGAIAGLVLLGFIVDSKVGK